MYDTPEWKSQGTRGIHTLLNLLALREIELKLDWKKTNKNYSDLILIDCSPGTAFNSVYAMFHLIHKIMLWSIITLFINE